MTNEEIAYLAGIVDGEGCIGVFTRGGRADWCRPHLQLTNTDLSLLAWLQERFDFGTVVWRVDRRDTRKPTWCWRVACDQALMVIRLVYPYLVIKRPQADAILRLAAAEHGRVQRGVLTADVRAARVVCFEEIRRLNYRAVHRGKRVA